MKLWIKTDLQFQQMRCVSKLFSFST